MGETGRVMSLPYWLYRSFSGRSFVDPTPIPEVLAPPPTVPDIPPEVTGFNPGSAFQHSPQAPDPAASFEGGGLSPDEQALSQNLWGYGRSPVPGSAPRLGQTIDLRVEYRGIERGLTQSGASFFHVTLPLSRVTWDWGRVPLSGSGVSFRISGRDARELFSNPYGTTRQVIGATII